MACATKRTAMLTAFFVVWGATPITFADSAHVAFDDTDAALLAESRIEPTRKGVRAFLEQLKTDLTAEKKAAQLIPQLGHDKFRVREAAMRELIEGPSLPLNALQIAAASKDQEVADRARRILKHPQVVDKMNRAERRPWICGAVCRAISDKCIQGATQDLFAIIPMLDDSDLVDAAIEAVNATASSEDIPLLRQSTASKNLNVRIAAIRGLARTERKAEAEFVALLDAAEPRLALAASHSLAERGDRRALSALVRLASVGNEQVRARSEQILRAVTGRSFGLNPFVDPSEQKDSLAQWHKWLANEGKTAELKLPVRLLPLPEDLQRGLLLHYTFDREVDGRLTDSSGQMRHGSPRNAHSFISGIKGKALQLKGTGDMGDAGGHVQLPFIDFMSLKQFTIAIWVNEHGMSDEHGEAYVVFGADRAVGVEDSLGISHFNESIYFRVGDAFLTAPFDKMDRDQWIQYALTFDDGRLLAYRNGRLVGGKTGRVAVVGKQAALGRHWWHHGEATSTRFIGAFDELRIYQRALAQPQVEQLFKATKADADK